MQLALIGVGGVGGTIVDAVTSSDRLLDCGLVAGSVAVDTAPAALASLRAIPRSNRVSIGSAYPCRDGVDGDNELGASIATEDIDAIFAGIDGIPSHHADAFLVVAALGGGTGGGGAPVIARELDRLFSRPVYGLGVLPSRDTDTATARRTVRSLVTFVREVDNLLLVDGARGCQHVDAAELARHIVTVFGADICEVTQRSDGGDEFDENGKDGKSDKDDKDDEDGEMPVRVADGGDSPRVDSDSVGLESVLAVGGLSILGHAAVTPPRHGLMERLWNAAAEQTPEPVEAEMLPLVQAATSSGIGTVRISRDHDATDSGAVPMRPASRAQRAWVVTTGTQKRDAQRGVTDERSRRWLCETTGVRTVDGRTVAATDGLRSVTLLLAGVRDVPRLTDLWERAVVEGCGDATDDAARASPETPTGRDRTFDPLF